MIKEYSADNIRNVVIVGHSVTGKSTLFEAMLYLGDKIEKMGNRDSATLVSDYDADEKEKKMSIRSALGFIEIEGVKINILDTPGKIGFIGESRGALQAADAAILVVDSVDGVQIQTESNWRYLEENKIPRIIFVNKMDKERADYDKVVQGIKTSFKSKFISICLPDGEGENFKGVVDIIDMKLMTPREGGKGVTVSEIPGDLKEIADLEKSSLMELAAEGDDNLIEKFLNEEKLTDDEIKLGLRVQLEQAKIVPIICGSSEKLIGVMNLIMKIKNFAPSPRLGAEYTGIEPGDSKKEIKVKGDASGFFSAVVWKTYIDQYAGRFNYLKIISGSLIHDTDVYNGNKQVKERISKIYTLIGNKIVEVPKLNCGDIGVVVKLDRTATLDTLSDIKHPVILDILKFPRPVFSYAVEAKNKSEVDKVGQFFHKIMDENPTVKYEFNAETKESVLSGMGEMQLDIILNALKDRNKLEVITKEPRVAYRETVTKKAESQYKHKKQSGGHGQYGEVYFRMAPLSRGTGYEFINAIVGGVVPKNYIPGIEKGVIEAMLEGVLAKYPVIDVAVELYYGSYHDVDSSEMAFKIAARHAFKLGMEAAGPQLLEPVMNVKVYVDKVYMGDILSDITSRRGRVLGMEDAQESGGSISVVKAHVPLSELLRYTIDLRAMTSGKASFEMEFSHYDPISGKEAEKIIEKRKVELVEEANK